METLGSRLKKLRERKGWTQKEAASRFGITNFQLSRYEGDHSNPDPDLISLFATKYETTTDYLLGMTSKPTLENQSGQKNLNDYQKRVLEWVTSKEDFSFYDSPDELIDMIEEFEIMYERLRKKE